MASGLPPVAAPFVAKILAQAGSDLASISGLTADAIAFADAWRVATAAKTTVEVEAQLYRLGTLHSPAGVIGKPRAAKRDDIDLLIVGAGLPALISLGGGSTLRRRCCGARRGHPAQPGSDRPTMPSSLISPCPSCPPTGGRT